MASPDLRERLRLLVSCPRGVARTGLLTAVEAARLLGLPPRNRVQALVRRLLARLFPPTQPPTPDNDG